MKIEPIVIIFSVLLTLAACDRFDEPHYVDVKELVVADEVVTVQTEGGEISTLAYSNGTVTVRPLNSFDGWATVTSPMSFEGDSQISVRIDANQSFRRMVALELSLNDGELKDTLKFMQLGVIPEMSCDRSYMAVDGTSGNTSEFEIVTNIPIDSIGIDTSYDEAASGWLTDIRWTGEGTLAVNSSATTLEKVTKGCVTLSYTDGWDVEYLTKLYVNRSDRNGSFGTVTGLQELRALATETGWKVDRDIIIEGLVIGDCGSENMELNPSVSYNTVDTTPSEVTSYMEAEDASCGYRLVFTSAEDNSLRKGSLMKINLNGTTLLKETSPVRYTIKDLSGSNFIGGSYDCEIPVKSRSIAELNDDDLYTFVSVRNTEFADKSGSYSNVYDTYSMPSDFNPNNVTVQMDCWPAMLIDDSGHSIYAIVNMLCPWRRTGEGVPSGSGDLTGILVHNELQRYGDVGKYQIRVVDASGYEMDWEGGSNYQNYAVWEGKYSYDYTNYGKYFPYDEQSGGVDTVTPSDDFNIYLPNNVKGLLYLENKKPAPASGTLTLRGCKVYDSPSISSGGAVSGKGLSIQTKLEGWYDWEDESTVAAYNGIRIEFSTASMSAPYLLFYVSFCAGGVSQCFKNYPAHWCAEYSTDGGATYTIVKSCDTGNDFVHLRTYPFASASISGSQYVPSSSTGMGFTEHLFRLPADVMGVENVKIRFRPYDTVMGSLPAVWNDPIEKSSVSYYTTYDNDIRFGAIRVMVPVSE